MTVAYADQVVQNELDMVRKGPPMDIHFHVDAYDTGAFEGEIKCVDCGLNSADELLFGDGQVLASWLSDRWAEKEKRLQRFYAHPEPDKRKFDSEKRLLVGS